MPGYVEKIEKIKLPVVGLSGIVPFPSIPFALEVETERDVKACQMAEETGRLIYFALTKTNEQKPYGHNTLYAVGVVAKIKQSSMSDASTMRIIAEPLCRAKIMKYEVHGEITYATVLQKTINLTDNEDVHVEALRREAVKALKGVLKFMPSQAPNTELAAKSITDIGFLSDFIASQTIDSFAKRQEILEIFDPVKRAEHTIILLLEEERILATEHDIKLRVNRALDKSQHEYYLREQIKEIRRELGDECECEEYTKKILDAKLPAATEEKLLREAGRMEHNAYGSPENAIIRTYLDTCLSLPWNSASKTKVSVGATRKVLNQDHYGLEKVKERILEYVAVKELSPELKSQIICLVGPPGVGKTSIASSIARSMKRAFVRLSLGGVRDEADIRGHRKTYIGSMPGRITEALIKAGVNNPVILLDEIDKISHSGNGNPAAALLEVLDPEQNKRFRDHYTEIEFDLSDCIFIATANTLETVDRPLVDRMEVIELKTYTRHEKLEIARRHLVPKQLKRYGLDKKVLSIADSAILEICDYYTAEAGVRSLERKIGEICRKAALRRADGDITKLTVRADGIKELLGNRKTRPEKISAYDEIGVVNGLAYTEVGGDLLKLEASVLDGTGKLELTGSLGDVMKESAKIALSFVRSRAAELGIDPEFYKKCDIHIHAPEGAVPKDGPSAGITLATVIASALGSHEICRDVAMTGEITLRGNVLAIGGLKEKTLAAYNAGVKRVIIPADNEGDLEEIDPIVRESLEFIPVKHADEVLGIALKRTASSVHSTQRQSKEKKQTRRSRVPSAKITRTPLRGKSEK
ncbi:MAG: endopeptidase La [Ruminococcaceae bacterium]|nr:endopeptidase La [Oscillospiraceae bacterium]